MMYAIISGDTFRYPIDLRSEFPLTSFPTVIETSCLPDGVVEVLPTTPPAVGYANTVVGGAPVLTGGVWMQTWTVEAKSSEDAAAALEGLRSSLCAQVGADRDSRIDGGFTFGAYRIQSRQSDRENVSTLGLMAKLAILGGAEAGDYHWHGDPDNEFKFIVADNTRVPMDAQTMYALFMTGVGFKSALTNCSRELKDSINSSVDPQAVYDAADWPS